MIREILTANRYVITLLILFCVTLNCNAKDFVVVIDPGHGGHDKGALGIHSFEKNINLDVALKFGDLIKSNYDDVKVVYTRDDDTYMTLQNRANFANKSNGDLFISIHTNSIAKKAKNRKTICGASTYTLGLHRSEENLEVAKRENSVIELEEDYTTTYKGFDPNSTESYIIFEINQSKHMEQSVNFASSLQREFVNVAGRSDKGVRQAGFWVLAATSMPSVLIELDFICNPEQEAFLTSTKGQEKMAKAIFNAFKSYKDSYDHKLSTNVTIKNSKPNNNKSDRTPATVEEKKQQKNSSRDVAPTNNLEGKVDKITPDDYKYSVRKKSVTKTEVLEQDVEKTKVEQEDTQSEYVYKIQFLTSTKKLGGKSSELKNLSDVDYYKEGGLYKYTYGATTSKSEANKLLNKVKSKFKKAFIVKFKDGKRIN